MFSDLGLAFRQLAKNPAISFVIVLTLALGIGACTGVFSVVDGLLLHPIGHDPHPERELRIFATQPGDHATARVSSVDFLEWEKHTQSFSYLRAGAGASLTLTGDGEPTRLVAARATLHFLETHGWPLAHGRGFLPEEDVPGKDKVIIVSYQIWQLLLGGDPKAVGRPVQINGEPYTLVGVIAQEVGRFSGADAFVPMAFTDQERTRRGTHSVDVWGRLKPGVTIEQARAELNLLAAQLGRQYPDTNKDWGVSLITTVDLQSGSGLREALWTLLGAVGCVLLISCANVANLLLARATARQREMAIRTVLGAGRGRLIRQLLTESVVLAVLGGLAGMLLAHWGLQLVHGYAGPGMKRLGYVELNASILGLALALSIATGIVFGLAPSWFTTGVNLNDSLKQGSRGSTEGGSRGRLRGALVALEVALAMVLLAGAGGLIRRLVDRARLDPGFNPERVTAMQITLPRPKYAKPPTQMQFVDALLARLRSTGGVSAVGATTALPTLSQGVGFQADGQSPRPRGEWPVASYYAVTPEYLTTMGIRLVGGRLFGAQDHADGARVAIVNETLARQYFPRQDPVGRRIMLATPDGDVWREIVGVVGDVTLFGDDTTVTAQVYEPLAQNSSPFLNFVVRSTGDPATVWPALKSQVYAVDKNQPISSMRLLLAIMDERVAGQRFAMHLLSVFSAIALVIAAIGIYAVIAYTVSQRTVEIGIRMALGAQTGDVLRLVFRFGGRMVGLGLLVGLVAAIAAGHTIEAMLYNVNARDPLILAAITLLLATVALVACLLPARRATRVNPMVALRAE